MCRPTFRIDRYHRAVAKLATIVTLGLVTLTPSHGLAQADPCTEPNDDVTTACTLASGATVQSTIDRPGDVDFFRFDVPRSGGQAPLKLSDLPADYDLYLVDANGGVLGQSVHEGTASEQLQLALQAGTYYAIVQADPSRDIDPSRPYTISLMMSAAQAPIPLAQVDSGAGSRRILLSDNFDDPRTGRFPTISPFPGVAELGYIDGEYSIRDIDPAGSAARGITLPIAYSDSILAVSARIVGPVGGRSITLECRQTFSQTTGSFSYTFFVIPAQRMFSLNRLDAGQPTILARREGSPSIHPNNDWNDLELACVGTRITLRINGEEVASIEDATYSRGSSRVFVHGPANEMPHAEVRLDNLVVYGP